MPPESTSASHDEELAALLAASPPRIVPTAILRAARRQQSASGPLGFVGVVFTLMGVFLVVVLAPWGIYRDWQMAAAGTTPAPGQVVTVQRTGTSVNKQRVYRYEFTFRLPTGTAMRGECFTTGARWRSGDAVTVSYSPTHPELSCIEGARLSASGAVGLIVFLFPTIGLGLLISTAVGRRRLKWLLENGAVAEAVVTAVDRTNMQINRQTVYRITLQRNDAAGGPAMVIRKYQSAFVDFARQRLETKQPVFVLYDPAHPKRALLPEAL